MTSTAAAPKLATISAQVPADLIELMKQLASQHDRSLSAEIRLAIRAHVADAETRAERSAAA